ncbi:MAG: hypothetical protein AABX89_07270 [Candidatus Thermoplasmatota archaeon]
MEQRVCSKFEYNVDHQGPSGYETKETLEEDWSIATSRVTFAVLKDPTAPETRLAELGGSDYHASMALQSLIRKIGARFIPGHENALQNEAIAELLLEDLNGIAPTQKIEAKAYGLVVLTEPIQLEVPGGQVTLSAVTREMFEAPRRVSRYTPRPLEFDFAPGTITIRLTTLTPSDVQRTLEKVKVALALFTVCNVDVREYSMSSSGLVSFGGTMWGGRSLTQKRPLILTSANAARLRIFWKQVWAEIPLDAFSRTSESSTTVALSRYIEACSEPRSSEYNLATTMMGLESLFTEGTPEISYRLRQRVSCVLSCLGFNGSAVHAVVAEGYKIRSILVHGGSVTYKERRRVENSYGGLDNLLAHNLHVLRIAILFALQSRMEKDYFLDLVDEAMFDAKKRDQMAGRLGQFEKSLGVAHSFS